MSRNFNVNPSKPTDDLVGANLFTVKRLVGSIHVATSYLDVVRVVFRKARNLKSAKKPLKRGLIKCILETHKANRDMYVYVMTGKFN